MHLNVVWQHAPVTGKLSQVTFPYKVIINNHSVKIEGKQIRYCSIVARGSLKTLACHSLPKYWTQKIQKSWNEMCDN